MELAAGAGAAALGALLAELARRQGLLRFAPELPWLAKVVRIFWQVPYDYAVLTWRLALHVAGVRPIRSAWVAVPFPAGGDDPISAGRRAAATVVENVSPNTIAADIDCERGVALKHDLVPERASPNVPS
jgi:hypothetical protein